MSIFSPVETATPIGTGATPDIQLEQQPTIKASTPIETVITPDAQLEQKPTIKAEGPIETGNSPNTQEIVQAAKTNEPATNEFVNTDVPTCANRRYPLRNRKPKVTQSMKSTDVRFPDSPFEPRNYKEAMQCDKAHLWNPLMVDEFYSHQINGTTPARYKSRIVAKGYSQVEGIEFQETYAPVVKYTSLRILLSYAAIHDW
ncbi:hypothetical protein DAPPUDRAFT_256340 [Daphnia pulex]|uniref:Reverse transcriptase Ty1/copia-type domain-containing protein n=1 Tax=Daphnia pulex TaxID=6669 RepID=E9HB44_DAPPU|nr:hypothetical protein DAPPUDRAFT_256340 [Daphnia pulex]|eukprot:EFX71034.1 hypothetical protein DAPPUDRAFT_256340 [Daphnia pulex]